MSDLAIEYLETRVRASHEALVAACQPQELTVDSHMMIHTAKTQDRLGIEQEVADYINPVAAMLAKAISRNYTSGAILVPRAAISEADFGGNILPRILNPIIKTGQITKLMIEPVAGEEVPNETLYTLNSAQRKKRVTQTDIDGKDSFFQIAGWGRTGSSDIRLGGVVGVRPYLTKPENRGPRTQLPELRQRVKAVRYPESVLRSEATWNHILKSAKLLEANRLKKPAQGGAGSLGVDA